jgi:proteasome lid subunit RPN8/RPN11
VALVLSADLLRRIQSEGEQAYPDEGAGFLLGVPGNPRVVLEIVSARNMGLGGVRRNRYLIGPEDYVDAEQEADRRQMDVLGVFHSHPDHPEEPSAFDREWAQPNFSYIITSIQSGKAVASKSWFLTEDRSRLDQESLEII